MPLVVSGVDYQLVGAVAEGAQEQASPHDFSTGAEIDVDIVFAYLMFLVSGTEVIRVLTDVLPFPGSPNKWLFAYPF